MEISVKQRLQAILFASSAIVSIVAAFLLSHSEIIQNAISLFSYWAAQLIIICTLVWLVSLYHKKLVGSELWRRNWPLLLAIFAGTLFLYTRDEAGFKIYFDEPLLSNIALNIHESREAVATGSSLHSVDHASVSTLDKRPAMFPTLLANVHDLFGYRIVNAFYLNGFITFAFLLLIYSTTRKIADRKAGYISIALCISSPLIAANSNGGGFDMLNSTLILAIFLVAIEFAKSPSKEKQTLLFLLAAAVANTRYESFIYILPVAATSIFVSFRNGKIYTQYAQSLIPILLVPAVWVQKESITKLEHWHQNENLSGIFSLIYIPKNLGEAFKFFLISSENYPTNTLISIVSTASCAYILIKILGRKNSQKNEQSKSVILVFFLLGLLVYLGLVFSYFWSSFTDPVASRLALPIIILMIITSSFGLRNVSTSKYKFLTPIAILLIVLNSLPNYAKSSYSENNAIPDYLSWIVSDKKEKQDENPLYISRFQSYLELHSINNISINQANAGYDRIAMHSPNRLGTYSAIYAVQLLYIDPNDSSATKKPLPGWELSQNYKLETDKEISFLPFNYIRISRVLDINFNEPTIDPYPYDKFSFPISEASKEGWLNSLP